MTGCKITLTVKNSPHDFSNRLFPTFRKSSTALLLSVAVISGNATATQSETQPVQYALTADQRQQVEQSWSNALFSHAEKLTLNFTRSMPDSYQDFADFRANDWQPAFDRDWERARNGFASFADRNTVEFQQLREISNAFFHLNQASLDMLRYLRTKDEKLLVSIREQLGKVEEIEQDPES